MRYTHCIKQQTCVVHDALIHSKTNIMSASKNIYDALSEQVQSLDIEEEWSDDEILGKDDDGEFVYKWEVNFFNVDEFEKTWGNKPIFTRKKLEEIKNAKKNLYDKDRKGADSVEVYIPGPGEIASGERFVVGKTCEDEDYDYRKIIVCFLSRIEMHPEFQKLRTCSEWVEKLRTLNEEKRDKWLPVPFLLNWMELGSSDHNDAELMARRRHQLQESKKLWEKSDLREQFHRAFRSALALGSKATRIKRIACFGLGSLQFNHSTRELQHLSIFDLAMTLENAYRSEGSEAPEVEVVLQDPLYVRKDHILLGELYRNVRFAEDPDGILDIDEETLVVGVYVPTNFPILQVVADMFDEGAGPAGFLIDHVEHRHVDKNSGMYRSNDRLSPRAYRMIQAYETHDGAFKDEKLKQERAVQRLWLEDMKIYIRRTPSSLPAKNITHVS